MNGAPVSDWCVQVRSSREERPAEHWVSDVDAFLATLNGPVQIRYTPGESRYIGRFRDLDSTGVSELTRIRYTEFGWRPLTTAASTA